MFCVHVVQPVVTVCGLQDTYEALKEELGGEKLTQERVQDILAKIGLLPDGVDADSECALCFCATA